MMPSKFPRCRLSAVGSKPQYTDRGSVAATFSSSSLRERRLMMTRGHEVEKRAITCLVIS